MYFHRKIIRECEITFVNLESDPIIICIDLKEIVFIPKTYQVEVKQFSDKFEIRTTNANDVWKLICYPFVNVYRSKEELAENERQLKELSFQPEEVEFIRKKVCRLMKLWVVVTMESFSLGLSDVLDARRRLCFFYPFYKRFYKFVIEIAIRGYKMSGIQKE
jgi:hypothetical protein